jgi:hypothetical protein
MPYTYNDVKNIIWQVGLGRQRRLVVDAHD